jgi:hypothetical protein
MHQEKVNGQLIQNITRSLQQTSFVKVTTVTLQFLIAIITTIEFYIFYIKYVKNYSIEN